MLFIFMFNFYCVSVQIDTQNVTKPVVLGPVNVNKPCAGNPKDYTSETSTIQIQFLFSERPLAKDTNRDEFDMNIISDDPKDEKITLVNELYFGSYASSSSMVAVLLPGLSKSWVGLKGVHCDENNEK